MTVLKETPARFTADEFLELLEASPIANWSGKTELVKGVITRIAPAEIPHWNAQRITFLRLHDALRDLSDEWLVGQEPMVRLAGDTIREPDVAILRLAGMVGKTFDRAALFLAIEIADSSLKLDLNAKRYVYAEAFVPHYWVVDLKGRRTHVMSDPLGGDYQRQLVTPFGEELAIPDLGRSIILD